MAATVHDFYGYFSGHCILLYMMSLWQALCKTMDWCPHTLRWLQQVLAGSLISEREMPASPGCACSAEQQVCSVQHQVQHLVAGAQYVVLMGGCCWPQRSQRVPLQARVPSLTQAKTQCSGVLARPCAGACFTRRERFTALHYLFTLHICWSSAFTTALAQTRPSLQ